MTPPSTVATGTDAGGQRDLSRLWWVRLAALVAVATTAVMAWRSAFHVNQLDLDVYLVGARHLADAHLYTVSLPYSPHLPFTYPPFAALFFWPVEIFGDAIGQLVWMVVNLTALAGLLFLCLRQVRSRWTRSQRVVMTMLLMAPAYAMEPVRETFFFGQVNLVLAVLVVADLTVSFTIAGRRLPRGLLVGVAAAIKLIPLVFVAFAFVTRQTRVAGTAVASFLACTLLALAVNPSGSWAFWTHYDVDTNRVGAVEYLRNQSLLGAMDRAHHSLVGRPVYLLVAALAFSGGLVVAGWAWRTSSPYLGLLVAAATGLLVSPISWDHHFVWVVPVILWLLWGADRPKSGPVWAIAVALFFWWDPMWRLPSDRHVEFDEHGGQLLLGSSFTVAALAFVVGVAILLWRRRDRAS